MKSWWTSWLFILLMTVTSLPVFAQDRPVLPPPDTALSWDVHRSLGIVLVFNTDQGKLYFAHPVLFTQLVSECRGVTWSEEGETMVVLERDTTGVPAEYTVQREPTAYRWEWSDWESMITGTYHR
jgi:hypothetical protein